MKKHRERKSATLCITMTRELRDEVEKRCRDLGMTKSMYFRWLHREARKRT